MFLQLSRHFEIHRTFQTLKRAIFLTPLEIQFCIFEGILCFFSNKNQKIFIFWISKNGAFKDQTLYVQFEGESVPWIVSQLFCRFHIHRAFPTLSRAILQIHKTFQVLVSILENFRFLMKFPSRSLFIF